jgi:hypothetical protein
MLSRVNINRTTSRIFVKIVFLTTFVKHLNHLVPWDPIAIAVVAAPSLLSSASRRRNRSKWWNDLRRVPGDNTELSKRSVRRVSQSFQFIQRRGRCHDIVKKPLQAPRIDIVQIRSGGIIIGYRGHAVGGFQHSDIVRMRGPCQGQGRNQPHGPASHDNAMLVAGRCRKRESTGWSGGCRGIGD